MRRDLHSDYRLLGLQQWMDTVLSLGMASLQDASGIFPTTASWAPDVAADG